MATTETTNDQQLMTLERLKSLYELIGRMNSVYDPQELLEFVVDRAMNLTGGQRGLLLLGDDHERQLQHLAVARGKELAEEDKEEALKFVSTTVIKDVLDQGEPRLVRDLSIDQRYEGLSRFTLKFKSVRSVLAVPLKVEEQLIGLVYIDHPKQAVFGQSDLDFLSAFANQAALAINRSRQHQYQIERLTLLNELSRSVVEVLDLDEVLTRIVHEATRMLNVETGSVLLLDEDTSELFFATSISNNRRVKIPLRLKIDQGIAGWVLSNGESTCVPDVSQDPRWLGREVETGFVTHSLLCVPLIGSGRAFGVIQALNKKIPHGFDSTDITLLSAFAASATIAIQNARLYQEARQARQLRILNEMALLLNGMFDLPTVLNTGLQKSIEALWADAGAISLIDDQTQTDTLAVQVSRGLSNDPGLAEKQGEALSQLSALILSHEIDEILVIDETHPGQNPSGVALLASGIKALAVVPIKAGREVNGTLAVMSVTAYTYNQDEISLLTNIAHVVGLAVQNVIHHHQLQRQTMRLSYLNEIGSALTSSLDLAHVLKVNIEGVNAMLGTERTSVFLIDRETNELVLRYTNDGDTELRLPAPWQGIAGWVAQHDKPELVNNAADDPRHPADLDELTGFKTHSVLCVPLKVEDQIIGVVEVLNKVDGRQFTLQDQTMLIDFTRWAAIAIHNANLFDERVKAYERLADEQKRRTTAETRAAMAAVILDMAHTMNNIVGAIRAWALTLEKEPPTAFQAPVFKRVVRQIRQNAQEAIDLIHKLQGPIEPPDLAPTDVHHCLDRAILNCWWPDTLHLQRDYGENLPPVKADATRLETVFHNLLSNAIQASFQEEAEIVLQTRLTANNQVQIVIADNGSGIPFELQEQVFNPGVSGKDGLGLGLWLAETFIHQFDGSIEFTSSETAGTTFVVRLQLF